MKNNPFDPPRPGSGREPETYLFEDDGVIPNNPRLPLVIYRNVIRVTGKANPAALFETLFRENGWTESPWRDGMYDFAHYHSRAHEVLGFARGRALIRFGGSKGEEVVIKAGDIVVIPAGVSHQRIRSSKNLLVAGAYPPGSEYDECKLSHEEHDKAQAAIPNVPDPESDPAFGPKGPLLNLWKK